MNDVDDQYDPTLVVPGYFADEAIVSNSELPKTGEVALVGN
jgi:hypothetical protein